MSPLKLTLHLPAASAGELTFPPFRFARYAGGAASLTYDWPHGQWLQSQIFVLMRLNRADRQTAQARLRATLNGIDLCFVELGFPLQLIHK
jgi:hypothetical protein